MAKKILCIGEALIDMICTDTGKTLAEGKNFIKQAGGAPLNVAAAIAALGGHAELIAKIGADPFGEYLTQVLQSFDISTNWVFRDETAFTTFAFVSMLENGEHDFYFNRGADVRLSIEEVDQVTLDEASILHFGSATAFLDGPLQAAYLHLLQKALQRNIFISFDPNYRQQLFQNNIPFFIEQSWHFLKHCQFFKLSREEALLLTGCGTIDAAADVLLRKTRAVFAITLGKDGALLGMHGSTCEVPGIPANPVDTTGAGDAFTGTVLYQLGTKTQAEIGALSADEWQHILYNANKVAATSCEYPGALEGCRHIKQGLNS
jgi:fructokinase